MNKYKIEISMEKRDEKMVNISISVSGKKYVEGVIAESFMPPFEQDLKYMIIEGYHKLTQTSDE